MNSLAGEKERTGAAEPPTFITIKLFGMQTQQRSRLMQLSWQIQRRRKTGRSKSLAAAWAIFLNEDITVYHLTRKHSHQHYPNRVQQNELTLFNR